MFERFTKEARAAVITAQTVARDAGSRSIDTRHLLVVLATGPDPVPAALRSVGVDPDTLAARIRDDLRAGGLDAEALASLGIDLDSVRARTESVFGEGALARAGRRGGKGHIPFTPDAKKALELALREAVRLGSSGIDGSLLLLGILRATGSPGERALWRALAEAGTDTPALRAAVEQSRAA